MRKLLLIVIATLSLGALALTQTAGSDSGFGDTQGTNNDWYNQHLAVQVQQFERIAAANAPSMTPFEGQNAALPGSMAANAGSQGTGLDWYNQRLAIQVQEFERIASANAPASAVQ